MDFDTTKQRFLEHVKMRGWEIKKSSTIPDKNCRDTISKCYFDWLTYTETTFRKFLDSQPEYINIDTLIKFFINEENIYKMNNSKNTSSKWQEMLPLYIILCRIIIPSNGRLPDYTNYKMIEPKRDECLICWWVSQKIINDPFAGQFIDLTKIRYQYELDGRYYDMCIEPNGIVIEIQEDSISHLENINDVRKEAIAKYHKFLPIYFKIQKYNECNYKYLEEFWVDELRPMIYGSLFKNITSDKKLDMYKSYIHIEFIVRMRQQYINCKNRLKTLTCGTEEYDSNVGWILYYELFNDIDASLSMISRILNWRKISKSNGDYMIPLIEVYKFTSYRDMTYDDVEKIIKIKYMCNTIDEKDRLCINIKILHHIILLSSDSDNNQSLKMSIIDYMDEIESIFMEIDEFKDKFSDALNKRSSELDELYINHMMRKEKEQSEPQIKRLQDKLDEKTFEINCLVKKTGKIIKCTDKFNKLNKPKSPTKKQRDLMSESKQLFEEISLLNHKLDGKNLLFVKIKGKSIIRNIPDFPFIYTGNPYNNALMTDFNGACDELQISMHKRDDLINYISPEIRSQSKTFPNIINILREDYIDDSKNEEDDQYKVVNVDNGEQDDLQNKNVEL
jgi:hypothetical protein